MKYRKFTILTLLALLLVSIIPLAAQDTTGCEAGLRLVEHEMLAAGFVCVPENPQGIIAHYYASDMVALGLPMIGTNYGNATVVLTPEQLQGITDIGNEPNIETVLSLEPDLIFIPDFLDDGVIDLLAEIAPTVVIPYSGDPFARLRLFGELVGQPEAADAWIDAYHAKAEARYEAVAPFIEAGESATAFIMYSDEQLYIYGRPRLGPTMYNVFGFTVPPNVTELFQDDPDELWKTLSVELLPEYVGDRIFVVQVDDEEARSFSDGLINGPIWQSLPAVQNGKVYYVTERWGLNDPLTLDWLLDEMAAVLTPVDMQDIATCEVGFRLFEDENIVESVCVPETAERIVTLDPFYSLQMSLEMDLPVIGSGGFTGDGGFPDTLAAEAIEGIEAVGAFEAPNLEAITVLGLDLIIGDAYFLSEQYELLNEIAPTVLIATADWKAWYRIIALAAGAPEQAEAAFDAYNARIADLQSQLPDNVTVSFLRVVPDGFQLYREAPNAYAPVAVMSDAGVTRPEFERGTDEESFARLDYEGLTHIEGDILLYVVGGADDEGEQLEQETVSNPIWQALPAVQAGQAYRVDADHWMSFGGLGSAHAVLDDLFRYIAGVEPADVSPNPFAYTYFVETN